MASGPDSPETSSVFATQQPEDVPEATLDRQQLRRRAASGVLAVGMRSVLARLLGIASNVVLARLLTPADFGVIAFGMSIVAIGAFFTAGGIGAALIKQHEPPTFLQLRSMFGLQLAMALAVVVVAIPIGTQFGEAGTVATVMTLSLPLDVARVSSAIVAARELRFNAIVLAEVGETVAYNVFAVAFVVAGMGVWGIALATILRAATGSTLLTSRCPPGIVRPAFSWSTVRPLLGFGLQLQGANLIGVARDQTLVMATGAIGTLRTLGQWSFTARLLQPITLVFSAVGTVAFPAVAGLIRAGEDPRPLVERGLRASFGLTGLVVVAVGASAPALVPSIFGSQWSPATHVLPWTLLGLLISGPITVCAEGFLGAIGEAAIVLRAALLNAVCWLVVTLPLLPVIGVTALGVGCSAAGVVQLLAVTRGMRSHLNARVVRNAIPAVGIAAGVWPIGLLASEIGGRNIPAGVAALVGAPVLYWACMYLIQRDTAREMVKMLRQLRPF